MLLKRMCALLLALAGVWSMALADGADAPAGGAAGVQDAAEPAPDALAGAWQLIEYGVGDDYYTEADLAERGELLELDADGAATRTRYGERESGEWTLADGAVALSMGGEELRLNWDGMALTLSDGDVSARYVRDTSALYALEYDAEQAQAMCNLVNGGLFARDGEALYGLSWDEDGAAMLAVRELTGDADVVGEAQALDAHCVAQYLNLSGDMLYYVRAGLDGKSGLYALELNGGAPTQLLEGEFGGLQLYGDRLYYLDAADELYSCALDGSDSRQLMGFAAHYAYLLDGDWLLYQSDEDDETLHAHRLSDGYDVALSDERSYLPVLYGGYVYYFGRALDADESERTRLCRLELATREIERTAAYCDAYLAVTADAFYTANGYKLTNLDAWWTLQNADTAELGNVPVYADDGYLVSLVYEDGVASRVEIERLKDGAAASVN